MARHEDVQVKDLRLSHRLVAGACAGLSYWVGTYPLDVIKVPPTPPHPPPCLPLRLYLLLLYQARMQSVEYEQRVSWLQAVRLITSGPRGLWELRRGLLPCTLRSVPACAAMFATVDVVRDLLSGPRD